MFKKNGFTLLEVLIVVVIAVSVAAFAVPAYKKTQEKNKYLAAQGVLLDLGTAVRALRGDLLSEGGGTFPTGTATLTMMNTYQNSVGSALTQDLKNQSNTDLLYSLFARNYMAKIAYDTNSSNKYKGFVFIICPDNVAKSEYCCGNNAEVVACMYNSDLGKNSSTAGQYYSAQFLSDGSLKRVPAN